MSSTPATPSFAPRHRKSTYIVVAALALFFLAIGAFGIAGAISLDGPLTPRLLLAFMALIGLGFPTWAFALCLRRRLRTGHWLVDAEERRRNYARTLARESSPTYRRLFTGLWVALSLFWFGLAVFWIRTLILHPQKLPWACYWIALSSLNVYWVIRNIRKPPFLTRPS